VLTMKPNGKPGELQAVLTWISRLVLTVLGILLSAAVTEGFLIWRDNAVIRVQLDTQIRLFQEHSQQQDATLRDQAERAAQTTAEVVAAKTVVDESFRQLDRRIARVETVCCGGSGAR